MINKKKHYENKIEVTQKKIWDMEFLLHQYKQMREGIRVEYDRLKEARDATITYKTLLQFYGTEKAKELMKNAEEAYRAKEATNELKPINLTDEESELIKSLDEDYTKKTEDLTQMEKQMGAIDKMVSGTFAPGEKSPLGSDQSVEATIENLHSVVTMLKDEIKKL